MEEEDRLGMTEEQWEWFQAATRGFGEQDENGVDISLIRENLRLTPTQRVEKLLRSLALSRETRRARSTARRPKDQSHLLKLECIRKLKSSGGD